MVQAKQEYVFLIIIAAVAIVGVVAMIGTVSGPQARTRSALAGQVAMIVQPTMDEMPTVDESAPPIDVAPDAAPSGVAYCVDANHNSVPMTAPITQEFLDALDAADMELSCGGTPPATVLLDRDVTFHHRIGLSQGVTMDCQGHTWFGKPSMGYWGSNIRVSLYAGLLKDCRIEGYVYTGPTHWGVGVNVNPNSAAEHVTVNAAEWGFLVNGGEVRDSLAIGVRCSEPSTCPTTGFIVQGNDPLHQPVVNRSNATNMTLWGFEFETVAVGDNLVAEGNKYGGFKITEWDGRFSGPYVYNSIARNNDNHGFTIIAMEPWRYGPGVIMAAAINSRAEGNGWDGFHLNLEYEDDPGWAFCGEGAAGIAAAINAVAIGNGRHGFNAFNNSVVNNSLATGNGLLSNGYGIRTSTIFCNDSSIDIWIENVIADSNKNGISLSPGTLLSRGSRACKNSGTDLVINQNAKVKNSFALDTLQNLGGDVSGATFLPCPKPQGRGGGSPLFAKRITTG